MIFKLIAEIIKDASNASNKKLDKNAYADFLNTLSIDDLIVLRDSFCHSTYSRKINFLWD
jgi:hypothetical protein